MKPLFKTEPAKTGGALEEGTFKIEANAFAFKVLIDGLYSDKIGSVVRELLSNGWDAQIEAGTTDRPMDIHLPSIAEPYFSVRDYGVAMDHETVMNVYSTLFQSTKRESNEVVGMLGLGSKSPFAISDQFDVTVWHGGMQREYSLFLSNGMPKINFLDENESDEPSGVLVSVPVTSNFYDFRPAVEVIVRNIPVKHVGFENLKPVHEDAVEVIELDNDVKAYVRLSKNGGLSSITQGIVTYTLPSSWQRAYGWMSFRLVVPIGAVSVTASREALSVDEETRLKLSSFWKQLEQIMIAREQADKKAIDEQRSWCVKYRLGLEYSSKWNVSNPIGLYDLRKNRALGADTIEIAENSYASATGIVFKSLHSSKPVDTILFGQVSNRSARSAAIRSAYKNHDNGYTVAFNGSERGLRDLVKKLGAKRVIRIDSLPKNVRATSKPQTAKQSFRAVRWNSNINKYRGEYQVLEFEKTANGFWIDAKEEDQLTPDLADHSYIIYTLKGKALEDAKASSPSKNWFVFLEDLKKKRTAQYITSYGEAEAYNALCAKTGWEEQEALSKLYKLVGLSTVCSPLSIRLSPQELTDIKNEAIQRRNDVMKFMRSEFPVLFAKKESAQDYIKRIVKEKDFVRGCV